MMNFVCQYIILVYIPLSKTLKMGARIPFDSSTVSAVPWSDFMKTVMKNDEFQSSRIKTSPFIRLDPSNPSTIYTALCFVQAQSEKHNLSICPVTFEQPLYQKATEIVAASRDLDIVVVRLGGSHMLMSYLGSIGQRMNFRSSTQGRDKKDYDVLFSGCKHIRHLLACNLID